MLLHSIWSIFGGVIDVCVGGIFGWGVASCGALPHEIEYWIWFRRPFHPDCENGASNNLSEMGAESGALSRRFLLPSHPR
jgi:hypothetical protein